jgi:hypothetical protein
MSVVLICLTLCLTLCAQRTTVARLGSTRLDRSTVIVGASHGLSYDRLSRHRPPNRLLSLPSRVGGANRMSFHTARLIFDRSIS